MAGRAIEGAKKGNDGMLGEVSLKLVDNMLCYSRGFYPRVVFTLFKHEKRRSCSCKP